MENIEVNILTILLSTVLIVYLITKFMDLYKWLIINKIRKIKSHYNEMETIEDMLYRNKELINEVETKLSLIKEQLDSVKLITHEVLYKLKSKS